MVRLSLDFDNDTQAALQVPPALLDSCGSWDPPTCGPELQVPATVLEEEGQAAPAIASAAHGTGGMGDAEPSVSGSSDDDEHDTVQSSSTSIHADVHTHTHADVIGGVEWAPADGVTFPATD